MSVENALLARARPYMLAAKARAILYEEVCKGCLPELSPYPLALKPAYHPILRPEDLASHSGLAPRTADVPVSADDLVRLRIWLSPLQQWDWNRSELFLKQLTHVRRRVAFEVIGNQGGMALQLLCDKRDAGVVSTAFRSQFDQCELSVAENEPLRSVTTETWARLCL